MIRRGVEETRPGIESLCKEFESRATRTHDIDLMARVFDQLIRNIPDDIQQFFSEGMQRIDVVDYPKSVRSVMEKYAGRVGG